MRLACPGLSSWFEKRATIVVPSPVLAAITAQQFASDQLSRGLESWSRPAIYGVDAWLASCWQQARYTEPDIPTLLSPPQERTLWESIIEREHPNLFDLSATARLARRAAALAAEWDIPFQSELWTDHEDGQQFREWQKLFRRKCREEGWIVRSDLWRLVPVWITKGFCGRELTVFAGFETSTPALQRVQQALGLWMAEERIGSRIQSHAAPVKAWDGFGEEIERAARWARGAYERHPSQSIAVLIPELRTNRDLVERVFRQVFHPAAALRFPKRAPKSGDSPQKGLDSVFHITAGAPLDAHPLIANAILLLEMARPRIHHADAGAILRCPFITGAAEERSSRALADIELRRRRELDVTLRDLERASVDCTHLARVWAAVRRVLRDRTRARQMAEWSSFIGDLLEALGWPGDEELNAEEQSVFEAWNDALASLETLGLVCGVVSYDIALGHLCRLLGSRNTEIGDYSSPIQVLDHSQGRGLEFDAAILTGLSDEIWPPQRNLSPLIPIKLLRTFQVPGSSPQTLQRERERATKALFQIAPEIAASYSGRLSPMVENFVRREPGEIFGWQGRLPRASFIPVDLDEFEDSYAPPYRQPETTRGGTSIIKAQSQCPFRAFAEFRLAARTPEDACFGFDSRDRGGFLHKALELVWNDLGTHARLLATSDEDLRLLVGDAVNQAVVMDESGPVHQLSSTTERERLQALILEWLAIERHRKHAFTVETVEQERYYEIPGLRLRLRVDRIDRLRNGRLLLIDYKSGPQTRGKLKCPRPSEPQLFVYAASLQEEVAGLFLAQLKPRELRAVGFSSERHFPGNAAEVRKDWDLFLEASQSNIDDIARDFVAGKAVVNPLHGVCEYCALKPLCRVNEQGMEVQES